MIYKATDGGSCNSCSVVWQRIGVGLRIEDVGRRRRMHSGFVASVIGKSFRTPSLHR